MCGVAESIIYVQIHIKATLSDLPHVRRDTKTRRSLERWNECLIKDDVTQLGEVSMTFSTSQRFISPQSLHVGSHMFITVEQTKEENDGLSSFLKRLLTGQRHRLLHWQRKLLLKHATVFRIKRVNAEKFLVLVHSR